MDTRLLYKTSLIAAILIGSSLFPGPAHGLMKVCAQASLTQPDGTTETWWECSEVPDADPKVYENPGYASSVTRMYTQTTAPREGPQPNEGRKIGDPIEIHGEFGIHETDLSFPGLGSDFQFTRSYSNFSSYSGVLGPGWGHNYEKALIKMTNGGCGEGLEYVDAQGSLRFHHKPSTQLGAPDVYEPDENGVGYRLEHVGGEYLLKDGSGLSYVFKEDGNPRMPWKPLVAIRDPLGHEQKIEWQSYDEQKRIWTPYDEKTWPEAKVVSVQDTTGRVIYFNYENRSVSDLVREETHLKCLSLGKDDTCQFPLVSFEYNDLGELAAVKDASKHGNSYVYDHGHDPEKTFSTVVTDSMCSNLCGSTTEDCHNTNICRDTSCLSRVSSEEACRSYCNEVYPFIPDQCDAACSGHGVHNTPYGEQYNAMSKKSLFDGCMSDFFKKYPYCKGSTLQGGVYSAPISTSQECYDQCKNQYETKDENGEARHSYGVRQDLNHNLIAVYDGEGRRIIRNQYGTDPSSISFDRVTDQWMGEKDSEENHIKLSYYDLVAEGSYVWNQPEEQPSQWDGLFCGSAYAAEGASIAIPRARIRVPINTEETPPIEAAEDAATIVKDPLCSSLCLTENEDWHNVRLCHAHDHDDPCLSQASDESDEVTKKKGTDACMVDFFKEHPDCAGFSLKAEDYYSETVNSPQECYKKCKDLLETEYDDGKPRLTYGARLDANHNVIAAYDEQGQRTYGGQESSVEVLTLAVDKSELPVSTQKAPALAKPSPLSKARSPRIVEAPLKKDSALSNTTIKAAQRTNTWGNVVKEVLRTPLPPLSPYVQSLSSFKSVTICPQLGDSEESTGPWNIVGAPQNPQDPGPDGPYTPLPQMSLIPQFSSKATTQWKPAFLNPQIHPDAQAPVMAVLVEDFHGGKRTYYLDKRMRLLREILFSAKGGGYQPYETTNYNNILKPGRMNRAVLFPSGARVCIAGTIFDLPHTVTEYPAPGYPGETSSKTSTLEYDSEGNQIKLSRKDGWSVEFVRDAQKRIKQIKTVTDLAKNETMTVTNNFETATDLIPNQILASDGSMTEQSDFDPWGIQPRSVTLDKNGAAPVSTYTSYYPNGRIKEAGVFGQKGNFWDYEANFLPKTLKVRKDPNSSWWQTDIAYNAANQTKSIETPEILRQLRFDSLGNLNFIDDLPKDKTSQEKKRCFNYSPDGRLLAQMFPGGSVAEYTYDPAGRPVSATVGYPAAIPEWANSCGALNVSYLGVPAPNTKKGMEEVFSLTYKPGGFLEKIRTDGVEYKIVTDGYGRIIDRIDPAGGHHRIGYSLFDDQVLWAADYDATAPPYGKPTFPDASLQAALETTYDGLSRPTAIYHWHFANGKPVGKDLKLFTGISYDDTNHTTTVTADNLSTITKYDGLGRILSKILPDNSKVTAQWDTNQNQVTWTGPGPQGNSIKTTQAFDGLGLVSKVFDDQGRILLEETHDVLGRVLESKPATGGSRHYTYDSFGRLLQTRQEAQPNADVILTNFWGANDELLGFRDGNGNLTQSRYDGQGRLVTVVDADNRETRYDYFPNTGRVHQTFLSDGNGVVPDNSSTVITNEYDASGWLLKQSIQHGANVVNYGNQSTVKEYTYNPLGLIATAKLTDANSGAVTNGMVNAFAYDSLGNVVLEKNSLLPFEIRHVTDPQGLKSSTTLSSSTAAVVIENTFDRLGRLGALTLDGQSIASFKYAGPGGPVGLDYGNGAVASMTYDNRGIQTDTTVKNRNQNPLLSIHVAYGLDGSPRWKQYSLGSGQTRNDLFQVDDSGRLIAEGLGLVGRTAVGNVPVNPTNADVAALLDKSPFIQKYALDPAANWTQVDGNINGAVTQVTFSPNATNAYFVAQGTAPKYDPAGNLTAFPANNPTESYDYNGLGQLLSATAGQKTNAFYYDALGRRVAEMNSRGELTYYVWDGSALLATGGNRLDSDSFTLNVTAGADAPFALVDHLGKGNKVYLHSGPDGSVMAASDDQSSLIEAYSYNAYGQPTFFDVDGQSELEGSKVGNRYLFQGMLYDADAAIYLTPARAYKPAWGRWLSPDPIGLAGGSNLYAFVGGRPLTFADPTGLCGNANNAKAPVWSGPTMSGLSAEESAKRTYAGRMRNVQEKLDRYLLSHIQNGDIIASLVYGQPRNNPDIEGLASDRLVPSVEKATDSAVKFAQTAETVAAVVTAPEQLAQLGGAIAFEPGVQTQYVQRIVSQNGGTKVVEFQALKNGQNAGKLVVIDKGNGNASIVGATTKEAHQGEGIFSRLFKDAFEGKPISSIETGAHNAETVKVLSEAAAEGRSLEEAFRQTPLGKVRKRLGFTSHEVAPNPRNNTFNVTSRRPP